MKLLFYGNCQTEAAMAALAFNNPDVEVMYAGNSNRVSLFDPERTQRLWDWCDHIITQPVMNTKNPDHHEALRQRFEGKITFMPYIWIDGLYSLCGLPAVAALCREASYVGQAHVTDHLQRVGLARTLQDFNDGMIDFHHQERFETTMQELARREVFAEIRIAPFVRDHFRDQIMMLTHNHPHPTLVNEIARQIAARLELKHTEIRPENHVAYRAITLPEFGTLLSPFGVRDLGLGYGYDLQWQRRGRVFIETIAAGLSGRADRPSTGAKKDQPDERSELTAERQARSDAVKAINQELRAQNAERQALIVERQAQSAQLKQIAAERQSWLGKWQRK